MDIDIQERLKEWARWFRAIPGIELGYPTKSTIGRMADERFGNVVRNEFTPQNEAAEEVEAEVTKLHQYNPNRAKILRSYYIDKRPLFWKAKFLFQISRSAYINETKMAEAWIERGLTELQIKKCQI